MDDLGPFSVLHDARTTFDRLIAKGGFDHVDAGVERLRTHVESALNRQWLIRTKGRPKVDGGHPFRDPPVQEAGVRTIKVGLIKFWDLLPVRAIPAFADLLGKRLARPDELLSFAALRPELPDPFWVVALGGSTDVFDGKLPAMSIRVEKGRRSLLADLVCPCAVRHPHVLLADQ
ncbi:MAG TPA: hypothetical protein VL500_03290 [Candidatus Eisenbacteria bacterium]|nr:hypothetical protein [Candidatus Eisenbacteria bacterium]